MARRAVLASPTPMPIPPTTATTQAVTNSQGQAGRRGAPKHTSPTSAPPTRPMSPAYSSQRATEVHPDWVPAVELA